MRWSATISCYEQRHPASNVGIDAFCRNSHYSWLEHYTPLAAVEALVALGVTGEDAAEHSTGPGSFHVALYDALYALSSDTIDGRARVITA